MAKSWARVSFSKRAKLPSTAALERRLCSCAPLPLAVRFRGNEVNLGVGVRTFRNQVQIHLPWVMTTIMRWLSLRHLSVAGIGTVVFLWLITACGGTSAPSNGSPSNAGTAGLGGAQQGHGGAQGQGGTEVQGGSTASTVCTAGDTRECVGSGACRGGQVCASAEWSACDCGSSGGASEGGNGAGGSVAGGTAETGAGGAENGGAPDETADPCPEPNPTESQPPWSCATDCFDQRDMDIQVCGGTPQTYPKACTNYDASRTRLMRLPNTITEGEVVLRTPTAASLGGPCACDNGTPVVAKLLSFVRPGNKWPYQSSPFHVHFTVRLPWHVGLVKDTSDCAPAEPAQCQDLLVVDGAVGNTSNLQIWTEDPSAPPVNVEMAPGDCSK